MNNIVKVSVVRCTSYDTIIVESAIRRLIEYLGGIERFVSKGEIILLKPNMLHPRIPEEAVTTHPEIVRAMIRLVRNAGATPIVGDSPGGRSSEKILRNLAFKTGIGRICEEEKVEFVFFLESQIVPFPKGVAIQSFDLTTYINKVDGIISLAKLKTHSFTGITGAVKNVFGLIPGLRKADYHCQMKDLDTFSELLVDLVECVKPRLTVIDSIVGMEGDGPVSGILINIGRIMASDNPHALDLFITDLIGADNIQTVEIARNRRLIPRIEIVGDKSATNKINGFKMPIERNIFDNILHLFGDDSDSFPRKPVFLNSKCKLCGSCVEICPGDAISLTKGEKIPKINRKLCIRCYCCQEVCDYNAIALKRLMLRTFLGKIIENMEKIM